LLIFKKVVWAKVCFWYRHLLFPKSVFFGSPQDITYCLEHRVKQAIETKRSHYGGPLRRALRAQGHILPEVVVIVACVRGSIPASTLDTLRNDLELTRAPAETILLKTHLAFMNTCDE